MTISPINNVNNNIRNLSFGENKEKPDTEKESQISTQTKVIVGTGLAALAAVGIYIATRGRGKVKPQNIGDKVENATKPIINAHEDVDIAKINPDFVKDENLLEVAKGLNLKILSSSSLSVFCRSFKNKLYEQYITALSKCKSPDEMTSVLNKILTNESKIDSKALNFAKNSKVDMDQVIKSFNEVNAEKGIQITVPANATPQEKMSLILSEYIKEAKKSLCNTLYPHYIESNKEILQGDYEDIIRIVNNRLNFLS